MRTFIRLGLVVVGIVTLTAGMVGADAEFEPSPAGRE